MLLPVDILRLVAQKDSHAWYLLGGLNLVFSVWSRSQNASAMRLFAKQVTHKKETYWVLPDGKRHGPYIRKSKGQVVESGEYKIDEADGIWTIVDCYGAKEVGRYINSRRFGLWVTWYPGFCGQGILSQVRYSNGVKSGIYTKWDINGQKLQEGYYIEGKQSGKWLSWHDNGCKSLEYAYCDGREIGIWTYWNEDGVKIREETKFYGHDIGIIREWYINGAKHSASRYENGRSTSWYENGQKQSEEEYLNRQRNGDKVEWYENGQMYSKEEYENGLRHGLWTVWYGNGNIFKSGMYEKDHKVGMWITYDINGQKCKTKTYSILLSESDSPKRDATLK